MTVPSPAGTDLDLGPLPNPDSDAVAVRDADTATITDPVTDTGTDPDAFTFTATFADPSPSSGGRVRAVARPRRPPPARDSGVVTGGSSSLAGVRAGRLPRWRATSPCVLPVRCPARRFPGPGNWRASRKTPCPARAAGRGLLRVGGGRLHSLTSGAPGSHIPFALFRFTFHERVGGWISLHVSALVRSRSSRAFRARSGSTAPAESSNRRWESASSAEP